MVRGSSEAEWLRRCGTLTAVRAGEPSADEHSASQAAATRLIALARALAASHALQDTTCALGTTPRAHRACELAADLAARGPAGPPADVPADQVPEAFFAALQAAAKGVYLCRRVEHASAACWFDAGGPHADMCGQVLAVAHALRSGLRDLASR